MRQALDLAIDEQSIVDTVTFGVGTVANSYIPAGALYYYKDNLKRPYDPAKAKEMLAAAGASDLTLQYNVEAGNEVDEQIAVLIQQQVAPAGITVNIQKIDPAAGWNELVAGNYDVSVNYWTNDILDPDQKTTFVLGHDSNLNYMTRYKNDAVKELVEKARIEFDPAKREQMYVDLQKMAKDDVNWIDLYYSPYPQRLPEEHRGLLPEPPRPILAGRHEEDVGDVSHLYPSPDMGEGWDGGSRVTSIGTGLAASPAPTLPLLGRGTNEPLASPPQSGIRRPMANPPAPADKAPEKPSESGSIVLSARAVAIELLEAVLKRRKPLDEALAEHPRPGSRWSTATGSSCARSSPARCGIWGRSTMCWRNAWKSRCRRAPAPSATSCASAPRRPCS